jgi:hypothetical protein
MPTQMFPKETDHECKIRKIFGIFFLGMEHALKQIQLELQRDWKCEALGCAKIAKSVPPFCFACIQALVDPRNTPSKCNIHGLSALDRLTRCYTYPCALMQALTLKEQVFCSNTYKQTLFSENEKSESSYASEACGHKKLR